MTIPENKKRELLKSVCRISAYLSRTATGANGVFISPTHVMTAWHVLQGKNADSVIFMNDSGEVARMKKGGYKTRSGKADLAIVEIDRAIGHDISRPINKHTLSENFNGTLAGYLPSDGSTIVTNVKQIEVDKSIRIENAEEAAKYILYKTDGQEAKPGHSGAPIIDSKGNVVSILTGGFRVAVSPFEQKTPVLKDTKFAAAPPPAVADLVDDLVFRLPG